MKKNNIFLAFIIPIIVVVALLAMQALCDLELPSYTSDIINNGIQQGGIEGGLPEVLTVDTFDAILSISNEDKAILASYDLYVTENLSSRDLETLKSKYPLIETENLYLLKDLTEEERNIVEEHIKIPLIITNMLESNNEDLIASINLTIPDNGTLLDLENEINYLNPKYKTFEDKGPHRAEILRKHSITYGDENTPEAIIGGSGNAPSMYANIQEKWRSNFISISYNHNCTIDTCWNNVKFWIIIC